MTNVYEFENQKQKQSPQIASRQIPGKKLESESESSLEHNPKSKPQIKLGSENKPKITSEQNPEKNSEIKHESENKSKHENKTESKPETASRLISQIDDQPKINSPPSHSNKNMRSTIGQFDSENDKKQKQPHQVPGNKPEPNPETSLEHKSKPKVETTPKSKPEIKLDYENKPKLNSEQKPEKISEIKPENKSNKSKLESKHEKIIESKPETASHLISQTKGQLIIDSPPSHSNKNMRSTISQFDSEKNEQEAQTSPKSKLQSQKPMLPRRNLQESFEPKQRIVPVDKNTATKEEWESYIKHFERPEKINRPVNLPLHRYDMGESNPRKTAKLMENQISIRSNLRDVPKTSKSSDDNNQLEKLSPNNEWNEYTMDFKRPEISNQPIRSRRPLHANNRVDVISPKYTTQTKETTSPVNASKFKEATKKTPEEKIRNFTRSDIIITDDPLNSKGMIKRIRVRETNF